MNIEYEATFLEVDTTVIRKTLEQVGAHLIKKEFLQKRFVFHLPKRHEIPGGWLRVRDEGDKITMSLKVVDGVNIQDQKETMLVVDSFEEARNFLISMGCTEKAYQESKRELWKIGDVELL